jgi:hypothetical protein
MKPLRSVYIMQAHWTHCKPIKSTKKIPWITGLNAVSKMPDAKASGLRSIPLWLIVEPWLSNGLDVEKI